MRRINSCILIFLILLCNLYLSHSTMPRHYGNEKKLLPRHIHNFDASRRDGQYLSATKNYLRISGTSTYGDNISFQHSWIVGPGNTLLDLKATDYIYLALNYGIIGMNITGEKILALYIPNIVDVCLYDINEDGHDEVIVANSTHVLLIDSFDTNLIITISNISSIAAADFSMNLGTEIVVAVENNVSLYSTNGNLLWSQYIPGSIEVYDISWDLDVYDEILVRCNDSLLVLDNGGEILWSYSFESNIDNVFISDLNGNGLDEVIVSYGNTLYMFSDMANNVWRVALEDSITSIDACDISNDTYMEIVIGLENTKIIALNFTLDVIWETILGKKPLALSHIDSDMDPYDEVFIGSVGKVFGLDNNGSIMWDTDTIGDIYLLETTSNYIIAGGASPWIYSIGTDGSIVWLNRIMGNSQKLILANIQDDDLPEIAISFKDGTISVFDRDYNEIFYRNISMVPDFMFGIDCNEDGYEDILLCLPNGTIISLNKTDVLWRTRYNGSITDALVSDLDLDGNYELIVCGDNGSLMIYNNGSQGWYVEGLNASSLDVEDLNLTYTGKEVVVGLRNGSLVIILQNGTVLHRLDVENTQIDDVLAFPDIIVYSTENRVCAINTSSYEVIWNQTIGGWNIMLEAGDSLPIEGREISFLSNNSYGIILHSGIIYYEHYANRSIFHMAHINGTYEYTVLADSSCVYVDNTGELVYMENITRSITDIVTEDFNDDLMDEIFILNEMGCTVLSATRSIWLITPENNSIYNTSGVGIDWGIFGFDPYGYRIYLNHSPYDWTDISYINLHFPRNGKWVVSIEAIPKRGTHLIYNFSILIDTEPPLVYILYPQNNSYFSQENITITWSGEDNTSGIAYYCLYINDSLIYNGTGHNVTTILDYGVSKIQLCAKDWAGNTNYTYIYVVMDNLAPRIVSLNISNGSFISRNNICIEWGYEEDFLDHFEVNVDNTSWEYVGKNNTYKITNLSYGQHSVRIRAVDKSGNVGESYVEFIADNRSPRFGHFSINNNSNINTTTVRLRVTILDDYFRCAYIFIDGDMVLQFHSSEIDTVIDLDVEGLHNITIIAIDYAGNYNTSRIFVNVDLTPPIVTFLFPQNYSYFNVTDIEISWVASDDISGIWYVQFRIDNYAWTYISDNGSITASLYDGTYILYIRAYDKAGNVAIARIIITIDTKPPEISILSPSNQSLFNTSTIELSWIVEEDHIYTITIILNGTPHVSTTTLRESLLLELNSDGIWFISIMAKDMAGNSQISTIIVWMDTTEPMLRIIRPENYTSVSNKSFRVVWVANDSLGIYGYYIRIDNNTWSFLGNETYYIIETISLATGQHFFYVMAIDMAGNGEINVLVFNITRVTEIPVEKRIILPLMSSLLFIFALIGYTMIRKKHKKPTELEEEAENR